MRISLVDSRTNGFRKWSDAQRPTDQAEPPHAADPGNRKADVTQPVALPGDRE